jgi:hypothetical protein
MAVLNIGQRATPSTFPACTPKPIWNFNSVDGRRIKAGSANDQIHCRERLGGMLNFYYRDAA